MISGFWIVGEGRPLRAELAFSTVATVTRIIARYEALCRGVARNFYILRQEIGLGFVTTHRRRKIIWVRGATTITDNL